VSTPAPVTAAIAVKAPVKALVEKPAPIAA
jgi:hypothetical protein